LLPNLDEKYEDIKCKREGEREKREKRREERKVKGNFEDPAQVST
jgi:hypothetical protein